MTFFRSLGGTIGVSVLGAVLANRVTADLAAGAHPAGPAAGGMSALNLHALPPQVQTAVHTVYGAATWRRSRTGWRRTLVGWGRGTGAWFAGPAVGYVPADPIRRTPRQT